MMLRVLDLFSGIGGFSLGLERAGMRTVRFVEIDPFCRKVLAKHWPSIPCDSDIRQVDGRKHRGVDVVCGGFPCKQTSVAAAIHGRRSGLGGADSSLFAELVRVVAESRPRWTVVENPAGVSSWESEIARCLEGAGYTVSRSEFEAKSFGAPHLRRRVFFVANADGKRLEIARPPGSPASDRSPWRTPSRNFWRKAEPGVWRMDDGVPHRVDRLTALGNAVIPQMVEAVGRAITESEQAPRRLYGMR